MNRDEQKKLIGVVSKTAERACVEANDVLEQIGMSPETYKLVVLTAISTTPKILECDPNSIRRSILKCATLGLLPDGDQAAIVPFKNHAQLVVGYKGMMDLCRDSIPGISIVVVAVTDTDEFEYKEGLDPVLDHAIDEAGERCTEKNFRAAYALAWMPGNDKPERVVMFKKDIEHIRKAYTHTSSQAWIKEYAEQAKKTVLRRLGKKLPIRSGLLKKGRDIGEDAFDDVENVNKETGEIPQEKAAGTTQRSQGKKKEKVPIDAEVTEVNDEGTQPSFEETSPAIDW